MKKHQKKIFNYGSDEQQYAELYKAKYSKNVPLVIVIHGGYWKDNHSLNSYPTNAIVDYLQNFNVAIWNLEYRRMDSMGENKKAPWPAIFVDIANGIDFLKSIADVESINLKRILLIGHSAGGHLATWAASRKNIAKDSELFQKNPLLIQKVISISGILNLYGKNDLDQPIQIERLMGGSAEAKPCRYLACDPSSLYSSDINLTLIHGQLDRCVSIAQIYHYAAKAKKNCQVEKFIMPNADHFSMLPHEGKWQEEEWQQLKKLIAKNIEVITLI